MRTSPREPYQTQAIEIILRQERGEDKEAPGHLYPFGLDVETGGQTSKLDVANILDNGGSLNISHSCEEVITSEGNQPLGER